MKEIRLVDGAFSPRAKSATLAGDNLGLGPKHFEWVESEDQSGVTFFTDICLELALEDKSPVKIAWLIEPPEVSIKHYEFIHLHKDAFDYILTWDTRRVDRKKWLFYPFGGSWIRNWKLYPKSKFCSIIASSKDKTTGHKLRHKIIEQFEDRIDVFGSGYNSMSSKLEALKDYQYAIIVENTKQDYWFTEKLIDCFATGTIPIYWGCPGIGEFFRNQGIIAFENLKSLDTIVDRLGITSPLNLARRGIFIADNFNLAKKYRCTEDWIFEYYPFLFKEKR